MSKKNLDHLSTEQRHVTQEKGTEPPFTGELLHNKEEGTYQCICCEANLFSSSTKFDSGTGWPSFWDPIGVESVNTKEDLSLFAVRTEVLCKQCDSHLGHVFEDGPQPTGLRYCINSVSLKLEED